MIFKSVTISLVGGLLLGFLFPQQSPPALPKKPSFIKQVPRGHYLGISIECQQLAEAREDSMENIIKQILQQIGAEYNLEFEKETYVEDNQVGVNVKDRFSYNTAGILADIEVKDSYYEKINKKYIFYTMVYFPQSKIIQARRLIEEENIKRLAYFELYIKKGNAFEAQGKIINALDNYRYALNQAEYLFKEKDLKAALAKNNIDSVLSRITLKAVYTYNQRNRHFISCKVFFNGRNVSDIPVKFQLTEGTGSITPLVYSDINGFTRCDAEISTGYLYNQIYAWVDIEGVDANLVFNFSSIEPKPIIRASPLEVRDGCFVFDVKESNDVDTVFDSYEIFIDAEYKNASFINYYIAHVDSKKHTSYSFDLLNPIKIKGGISKTVRIPFNSWTKEKIGELDNWYMGSKLDYRIILKGATVSITIHN